jgi:hypothetical protein
MKLFIVSTDDQDYGYDVYESFVIAANTPVEAKQLAHRLPCREIDMKVEYIGTAFKNKAEIVHSSFNRGLLS